MKVLIIGAGDIGFQLAKQLSLDKHDITIIERDPQKVRRAREQLDAIVIEGHGETVRVLKEADMVGSTSGMIRFVADQRPERVVMITECSMSDNVSAEFPDVEFVRSCTICPHMKRITLENIRDSLLYLRHEVEVAADVAERARLSVEKMLAVGRGPGG